MIKKLALLLALVMVVSAFAVSCGAKDDNSKGKNDGKKDDDNGETTDQPVDKNIEDTSDDENNYYYNPKIAAAYRVDDKTVRVKFSLRVYSPLGDPTQFIYASSTIFGSKVKAKSYKILDPGIIDRTGSEIAVPELFGMTFDIKFESKIPEDGYICFEETIDTDHDAALDNVLCDNEGAGLYAAYRPVDGSNPVAAMKYTSDEIEAPEMPTILMRAYCEDPVKGAIIFEFSKPVAIIDRTLANPGEWSTHIFVCDKSNPTPGISGSWQYSTKDEPIPLDPQFDKNGNLYASKWECCFNDSKIPAEGIPENGVFRICENNAYADENNPDEGDDDTLGRLVVGIDGVPLAASRPASWDVAHCKYSTDESCYISGGNYYTEE